MSKRAAALRPVSYVESDGEEEVFRDDDDDDDEDFEERAPPPAKSSSKGSAKESASSTKKARKSSSSKKATSFEETQVIPDVETVLREVRRMPRRVVNEAEVIKRLTDVLEVEDLQKDEVVLRIEDLVIKNSLIDF